MTPNVDIYTRHQFACECSRTHTMPIGAVDVGAGAVSNLPAGLSRVGLGAKGTLITDEHIFEILGKQALEGWRSEGVGIEPIVLPGGTKPDETAVGQTICRIPMDTDYLVSIGGGTVTDIVRYVGHRLRLPVVAIPSAMTMDGFFTNMSVIIVNGVQYTYYLDYPAVILADTDIIGKCPPFMNAAGLGEVIAKISAGLDWFTSHLVKDTYYCDRVADMMNSCISQGTTDLTVHGIPKANPESLANLTDSLYRSAVGMAWYGSSTCGSGAEHQLNHFWIMCQDLKGHAQSMHGQAVGAGTVANLTIWDEIMKRDLSALPAQVGALPKHDEWEAGVRRTFAGGAEEILALQRDNHSFDRAHQINELERIRTVEKELRERFRNTPTASEIAGKLTTAGCPSTPKDLGITRQEFIDSVLYAKEMRAGRYNSLWMIETLGQARDIAETVADRLGY